MLELADALGAMQQANAVRVTHLSGSWDWCLVHVSGAWSALLQGVVALADATVAHLKSPSRASSADLLRLVCLFTGFRV